MQLIWRNLFGIGLIAALSACAPKASPPNEQQVLEVVQHALQDGQVDLFAVQVLMPAGFRSRRVSDTSNLIALFTEAGACVMLCSFVLSIC